MRTHISWLLAVALATLLLLSWISPVVSAAPPTLGTVAPGTPNPPDPPLNPTALYAVSGDYSYVAAGAAMRDQGYGSITVAWTGTLVAAYLIWAYINPSDAGLAGGTFNGQAITGTYQSSDTSPCWGDGDIYSFAADVTSLVQQGANSLTGFPSGIATGADPWGGGSYVAPLDEGASLVVVYTPVAAVTNQVYIYTGTYTSDGGEISSTFNHGATILTTGTTTFMVADGQLPGNTAFWNGAIIDSNAFGGHDPRTSMQEWSYGDLWDTKTYSVTETLGSTTDSASIAGSGGDCITWAGQALLFPSLAPIGGVSPPVVVCPDLTGGVIMATDATWTSQSGSTFTVPGGNYVTYFFAGPQSSVPGPILAGWGGNYGTYNGQLGWIVTFNCPGQTPPPPVPGPSPPPPGSSPPAPSCTPGPIADSITFTTTSAVWGSSGNAQGVFVPVTNCWSTTQSLTIYTVLQIGLTIYVLEGGGTIGPGQTMTVFCQYFSAIVPVGSYVATFSALTTTSPYQAVSAPTTPLLLNT